MASLLGHPSDTSLEVESPEKDDEEEVSSDWEPPRRPRSISPGEMKWRPSWSRLRDARREAPWRRRTRGCAIAASIRRELQSEMACHDSPVEIDQGTTHFHHSRRRRASPPLVDATRRPSHTGAGTSGTRTPTSGSSRLKIYSCTSRWSWSATLNSVAAMASRQEERVVVISRDSFWRSRPVATLSFDAGCG